MSRTALALSATFVILVGCAPHEEEQVAAEDALDMQALAVTVDEATNDVDRDVEEDVAEDSDGDSVWSLRESIRNSLLALAAEEECGLRGVLGGRWFEGDEAVGGTFRGRAYRRLRHLVGRFDGAWAPWTDQPGGTAVGTYDAIDAVDGTLEGGYLPPDPESSTGLGSFDGSWLPDPQSSDAPGGNLGGVWRPLGASGNGFFVGYWSNCAIEPNHR